MNAGGPIYIRLMSEFGESPLWGRSWARGIVGQLLPSDLGLDEGLTADLIDWNARWADGLLPGTYDWEDPLLGPQHMADGYVLAQRLRDALGPDFVVLYAEDEDPPIEPLGRSTDPRLGWFTVEE